MYRVKCQLFGQALLIVLAMSHAIWGDGFDQLGVRAVFRDFGVSHGPGYHHPSCLPHLRHHYDMAVAGHPLPASYLTPLHFLNSSCMQASRYVPAAYAAQAPEYSAGRYNMTGQPAPALNGYQPGLAPIAMPVAMPADTTPQHSIHADAWNWNQAGSSLPPAAVEQDPASTFERLPRVTTQRKSEKIDEPRSDPETPPRSSSLESPFEPYSPNDSPEADPSVDRSRKPFAPERSEPNEAGESQQPNPVEESQPRRLEPPPLRATPTDTTEAGGGLLNGAIEIQDDLVPNVGAPAQP